ncbi:MAG: Formyl-coenzyme A transferase (Formyl-CoA transferase) [Clostridiales bacterium 38_11]|nr:MAG: Formyl-coenzyme A transferase (Formyl-CoA transferase) [Clostridiales bacterium 38_11]
MNQEKQSLRGLKVLDMTQFLAGPYCGLTLADLGAEVIKVENPSGGDYVRKAVPKINGVSMYFENMNRGKKGITLNLKTKEGKELFAMLLAETDVLIENNRPGVMERLGFSYEQAKKINCGIIYCSISGFGQTGPYSQEPGYDLIGQAMSGAMSITGMKGMIPLKYGVPIGDVLAGMNGIIGILAALNYRNKTGEGQYIDTSLVDGLVSSMLTNSLSYFAEGTIPGRSGNRYFNAYPYDSFTAKNGEYVVACGTDQHFIALANAMGMPELAEDSRFQEFLIRKSGESPDALKDIIDKWGSDKTVEECVSTFKAVQIPTAPIYDVKRMAEDKHIRDARKMFVEVEHPVAGKITITGNPIKMSATPTTPNKCAPLLGEHNEEIYGYLGIESTTLKEYKEKKII